MLVAVLPAMLLVLMLLTLMLRMPVLLRLLETTKHTHDGMGIHTGMQRHWHRHAQCIQSQTPSGAAGAREQRCGKSEEGGGGHRRVIGVALVGRVYGSTRRPCVGKLNLVTFEPISTTLPRSSWPGTHG